MRPIIRLPAKSVVLLGMCVSGSTVLAAPSRVAVSWNLISGEGRVAAVSTIPPYQLVTSELPIGPNAVLRHANGKLYAVSGDAGTIVVIDETSWTIDRTYSFSPPNPLMDIVVVDSTRAYVTRGDSTHVERLDLATGALTPVVDLSPYADGDGIPDLGLMTLFEDCLFVQLPRKFRCSFASNAPSLAVIDVNTEQLIDANPIAPGVQLIALQGSCPGRKMPVVAQTRALWVSASGGYNDFAGYERVNIDTLQSMGIFIHEGTDIASDVGPIVMTGTERGYVVSGTDSTLSSHVRSFTLGEGLDPTEWHFEVGYDLPEFEFDPATDRLFVPVGTIGSGGVYVFDATTSQRLTPTPISTGGHPTDLELMCDAPVHDCATMFQGPPIPALSSEGTAVLIVALLCLGGLLAGRKNRSTQPVTRHE